MGGLGPGIGGAEWLVIGVVALLVVGPERLPGLLRQLGKWVAKARGMANEFRSSFEDMARQSELDELRKEVEALRTNPPVRLGAEADAAFKDIKSEFDKPLFEDPVMTPAPSEWPDGEQLPLAETPAPLPLAAAEPAPETAPVAAKTATVRKPRASKAEAVKTAKPKAAAAKTAAPKAKSPTARKAAPRKTKLDL
jgi:sec-independent protein translocase protein TatB